MLLQKALRELDGEIDRLSRIRAIVAGLHTTSSPTDYILVQAQEPASRTVSPRESPAPAVHEANESMPPVSYSTAPSEVEPRKVRKMRFERTTRTRRSAPTAARALGGSIPVQPVFIAPANIARISAPTRANDAASSKGKNLPAPMAPEGTLDALLRELSYRPSQGA